MGANHHSDAGAATDRQPTTTARPDDMESWTRFHEQVEALPDDEREVVALLWYEGLSQPEAAALLGVSLATVKRRWQAARLALYERLDDWAVD